MGRGPRGVERDLVYGRNAVVEAARAGRVKRALVAEGLDPDPRVAELARLAPVERVPAARLGVLASGVHQGVVAELKPRAFLSLRELLETGPDLLVALDGVEDPQNLGAILRSAEGAGAGGAVLPQTRAPPLSPAPLQPRARASAE